MALYLDIDDACAPHKVAKEQLDMLRSEITQRSDHQWNMHREILMLRAMNKELTETLEYVRNDRKGLRAENALLRAAVVEFSTSIKYIDSDDDVGYHVCCDTLSYEEHAYDCIAINSLEGK